MTNKQIKKQLQIYKRQLENAIATNSPLGYGGRSVIGMPNHKREVAIVKIGTMYKIIWDGVGEFDAAKLQSVIDAL